LKDASTVHLVEGEKTATKFQEILPEGHVAISLDSGANTNIDLANIPFIKGKIVYIYPDIDTKHSKGQEAAIRAHELLKSNNIECYIIDICLGKEPTFSGYDVEDYIHDGHSYQDIAAIIESTSDETSKRFLHKYKYGLKKIRNNTYEFEAKYVNEILSSQNMNGRCNVIKSLHGTGKTELMCEVVEEAKQYGNVSIVLTHRRSLADQTSKRMEIPSYLDDELQLLYDGHKKQFQYSGDIICSADSIKKLNLAGYRTKEYILIVDEIDQFMSHYINGSTCKENRKEIADSLKFLFKHAQKIYLLSADIPDYVFKILVGELGVGDVVYYDNKWKETGKIFIHHEKYDYSANNNAPGARPENEIVRLIENDLQEGKRASFGSATKKDLNKLKLYFELKFPDKKILTIDEDNSQTDLVNRIKRNPEILLEYDFFGYSPTLFSGVDFNIPFSENHYLISNNGPLTDNELLQGAMRFRKAKNIHFYISHNTGSRPMSPDKIHENLKITEEEYSEAKRLNGDTGCMEPDDDRYKLLIDAHCLIKADHNKSKNALRSNFIALIKNKGFELRNAKDEVVDHAVFNLEMKNVNKKMMTIRNLKKKITISGLQNAPEISDEHYEHLQQGLCETDDDVFMKNAHAFVRINGESREGIDKIYEEFHANEPMLLSKKIDNYRRAFILSHEENLRDDINYEDNLIYDRPNYAEKAQVYKFIMDSTGLMDGETIQKYEKLKLARLLKDNYDEIGRVIGLQTINALRWIPSDDDILKLDQALENGSEITNDLIRIQKKKKEAENKAGYWLRGFISSLGLKLEKEGRNDDPQYYLDMKRKLMIEEIIKRQDREKNENSIYSIFSKENVNNQEMGQIVL
jgi:hypothetical protein